MRRLLAYQLQLSVEKGRGQVPQLARGRGRREQEESASPVLRRRLEVEEIGLEGARPGTREEGEKPGQGRSITERGG